MSCRNVETIITELARGQMLEARAKEDALAHLETCQRCAARFADEQTLTNGLRAVSVSAASMETPARVEAALLSAFRQGATAPADFSRHQRATISHALASLVYRSRCRNSDFLCVCSPTPAPGPFNRERATGRERCSAKSFASNHDT